MMAPTVELLAHADLHPALSDLLVEAAQEVHGRGSLMQNPGEFPHALEHDYPMSEGAARYYKSGKSLAYRYLPFWAASLVSRARSEEHTSELQSLMRISYAVFCLKKKTYN